MGKTMDKVEGVSRELAEYMIKNIFTSRRVCQDCRTFLLYSPLKMECVNPDSPNYHEAIGKLDSCAEWEKRIND